MPDTTETIAKASLEAALASGQSITEGNLSVAQVPAKDAYDIAVAEANREGQKAGRRPLFRGINLGTFAS